MLTRPLHIRSSLYRFHTSFAREKPRALTMSTRGLSHNDKLERVKDPHCGANYILVAPEDYMSFERAVVFMGQ